MQGQAAGSPLLVVQLGAVILLPASQMGTPSSAASGAAAVTAAGFGSTPRSGPLALLGGPCLTGP